MTSGRPLACTYPYVQSYYAQVSQLIDNVKSDPTSVLGAGFFRNYGITTKPLLLDVSQYVYGVAGLTPAPPPPQVC